MTDPIAIMQDVAASVVEAAEIRRAELIETRLDAKIESTTLYLVFGWRKGRFRIVPAWDNYFTRAIHEDLADARKSMDAAGESYWRRVKIVKVELE